MMSEREKESGERKRETEQERKKGYLKKVCVCERDTYTQRETIGWYKIDKGWNDEHVRFI